MKLKRLFIRFLESEKTGGLLLVFITVFSLAFANSPFKEGYVDFWKSNFGDHSLTYWINEGLMAIFFLLIGLELESEFYRGELSNIKSASFSLFGALGGICIPAVIFLFFNMGKETLDGIGIPMATDIAFAIGILSLLGRRVSNPLKVFLTSLAVIDDLGAILVIAIFYSKKILWINLSLAMGVFIILLLLNKFKVRNVIPYLLGGVVMWYFMLHSGIHATVAGVFLAFAIPFRSGYERSASKRLQRYLHKPVALIILPLFAAANTCIVIGGGFPTLLAEPNSLGIIVGLVIGKPLGIFLFTFLGTTLGLCALPSPLNWKKIIGVGFLGGIGFTMSIFITLLAYDNEVLVDSSKLAIIVASVMAAIIGVVILKLILDPKEK